MLLNSMAGRTLKCFSPIRCINWFKGKERKMFLLGVLTATFVFVFIGSEISYKDAFGHQDSTITLTFRANMASENQSDLRYSVQGPSQLGQHKDYNAGENRSRHVTRKTGYDLALSVNKCCSRQSNESLGIKKSRVLKRKTSVSVQTYSSKQANVKMCPVWKAGTTFFKRLFAISNVPKYKNTVNPFDLSFLFQYTPRTSKINQFTSSKTFLFVRDPYHRLLSGYVDKLLAPNPIYWKLLGIRVIRTTRKYAGNKSLSCGHDLTFQEYAKYVAMTLTSRQGKRDMHFETMASLCKPCDANYDFIGKMENLNSDSIELLKSLNLNDTINILALNGSELVADDAIRDTTYQPFDPEFTPLFDKCLDKGSIFQRSWTKLKIRGLIGNQNLTLDSNDTANLTYEVFLQMARNARKMSTSKERRMLKEKSFLEMYSTVDKADMERLAKAYAKDFELFQYDPRPASLFQ